MKKPNSSRFPVARIKKLIQADEDVGKVASATPIVVSKALELFLGSLVAECVKDATARGSNKITAYGLKRTINSTETFDFCSDIVANVPDPITEEAKPEGDAPKKKRAKRKVVPKNNDSDDEDEVKAPPKKRKAKAKAVKDEEESEVSEEKEEKAETREGYPDEGEESMAKTREESDYSEGSEFE